MSGHRCPDHIWKARKERMLVFLQHDIDYLTMTGAEMLMRGYHGSRWGEIRYLLSEIRDSWEMEFFWRTWTWFGWAQAKYRVAWAEPNEGEDDEQKDCRS